MHFYRILIRKIFVSIEKSDPLSGAEIQGIVFGGRKIIYPGEAFDFGPGSLGYSDRVVRRAGIDYDYFIGVDFR